MVTAVFLQNGEQHNTFKYVSVCLKLYQDIFKIT